MQQKEYFVYTQLQVDKTFKDQETPSQLKLWIVATHSDMPINMRIYKKEEIKKAVATWTHPFQKPVLRHHDNYTDAIGRVVEAYYIDRQEWDAKVKALTGKKIQLPAEASGGILLKAYVTDEEAIKKVMAGNYTTVSVGFFADALVCNICGKPKPGIFDEPDEEIDFCPHETGHEYDGVIAYDVPLGIQYREISFVNTPADSYAGIARLEVTSLDEALKEIKNEPFGQDKDVNSTMTDSDVNVNSDKEGSDMEELKKLQDAYTELESKYKELEDAYNKKVAEYDALKEAHDKLLGVLKEDLIDRVAGLKAIILGIEDAEAVEKIKEGIKDYSIDTLKTLEKEYKALVDSLLIEKEDAECEECKEEGEDKTEEPAVEEELKEEVKEDEEKEEKIEEEANDENVEFEHKDEVNLQKEMNPITTNLVDSTLDLIDQVLGFKK